MKHSRHTLILAAALVGGVALVGCKKDAPAPAAPVASEPAPVAAPEQVTPTVSVIAVALGNDEAVSTPATTFAPGDTIYAAVNTQGSDPNAQIPGKLGVKWTHVDSDQTVNEESRDIAFTGPGTTTFHVSNPGGWPTGTYRLEVSLDGTVVSSSDFEVK